MEWTKGRFESDRSKEDSMRNAWIGCSLLGVGLGLALALGGCDTNPEWDTPVAIASGFAPEVDCDAEDDRDAEDEPHRDDGGEGVEADASDACGTIEPDACGEGQTACMSDGGWFCADLQEHDEHCGECFNECAAYGDATCNEGECYCKGGPWMQLCAEGCTDTREDPAGCGVGCVDCREEFGVNARCETGICAPAIGV
jgi:hypothetical protein